MRRIGDWFAKGTIAVVALLAGSVLIGCISSRPYRDTIANGDLEVKKEEAAELLNAALDAGEDLPAAERLSLYRQASSELIRLTGAESDPGTILVRALAASEDRADPDLLEAGIEEALDSLSFSLVVEADIPAEWPEPSLPGLVRVKSYPSVRLAMVDADETDDSLFMSLFDHISDNDIAMTAPVAMNVPGEPGGRWMSFLYGEREWGPTGREGAVEVTDSEPLTVASIGLRGSYSDDNFREGLARLKLWLEDEGSEWATAGEPRVLGYNSPFVPWFLKYSEVQIPIRPR